MTQSTAKPLLELDRQAKALLEPYRETPVVRALGWLGSAGDQPQLRLLNAGLFAAGAVRGDARMMRAGVRMLAAHELATFAKNTLKRRIDRARPRGTSCSKASRPRKGDRTSKEMTSFPSGHSAGAMAVAAAFAAEYPQFRIQAYSAAGAVALIQIPTAAHYPSDVAAGSMIGTAAAKTLSWIGVGLAALATFADRSPN